MVGMPKWKKWHGIWHNYAICRHKCQNICQNGYFHFFIQCTLNPKTWGFFSPRLANAILVQHILFFWMWPTPSTLLVIIIDNNHRVVVSWLEPGLVEQHRGWIAFVAKWLSRNLVAAWRVLPARDAIHRVREWLGVTHVPTQHRCGRSRQWRWRPRPPGDTYESGRSRGWARLTTKFKCEFSH